jgi:hypothetical protein
VYWLWLLYAIHPDPRFLSQMTSDDVDIVAIHVRPLDTVGRSKKKKSRFSSAGGNVSGSASPRQGLTLLHFSAQPDPLLSLTYW